MRLFQFIVCFLFMDSFHSLVSLNTVWKDTKGNPISVIAKDGNVDTALFFVEDVSATFNVLLFNFSF